MQHHMALPLPGTSGNTMVCGPMRQESAVATEHFRTYRAFLAEPERYLRHLLDDAENGVSDA